MINDNNNHLQISSAFHSQQSFQCLRHLCVGCKSQRLRYQPCLCSLDKTTTFPSKRLAYQLASFTFSSKGFRLAYQLAPCSRTYSQPHGRVLSPSWPHRLPRNQKTLFELTINNIFHQESDVQLHNHSSNGPLRLSFLPLHGHRLFPQLLLLPFRGGNFSTNNNQQTSQVHDGATEAAPLLTRLCGRALPPSISSRFILQDQ